MGQQHPVLLSSAVGRAKADDSWSELPSVYGPAQRAASNSREEVTFGRPWGIVRDFGARQMATMPLMDQGNK